MRVYATAPEPAPEGRAKRREVWQSIILPYALLFLLLTLTGVVFGFLVTNLGARTSAFDCLPNGDVLFPWQENLDVSSTWATAQFLSINLGFGTFSFAAAKAIDISWDLVVGRGGQAALIWMCYPLFRRALCRVMETKTVSLPVFAAIDFDKVSLGTLSALCRPALSNKHKSNNSRLDWRFVLLSLAITYLLAFPTFLSAFTGYQARTLSYVEIPNAGLERVTEWTSHDWVVKDGSRIGLQDSATFDWDDIELYSVLGMCYWLTVYPGDALSTSGNFSSQMDYLYVPERNDYDDTFGWCSFHLPANATYLHQILDSSVTLSNKTYTLAPPLLEVVRNSGYALNPGEEFFTLNSNITLGRPYIAAHSFCEMATTYQWGFSSIPLFIFFVLTAGFVALLVALQQDAHWNGRTERHTDVTDTNAYRDVLDMAEELKSQLGDSVQRIPAKELKRLVDRKGAGTSIDTDDLGPCRSEEKKSAKLRTPANNTTLGTQFSPWRRADRDDTAASTSSMAKLMPGADIELQTHRIG